MNFPSKTIEDAVAELSSFPGIGKKTALRMVLHLLKRPEQDVRRLTSSILNLKTEIAFCAKCGNISDKDLCSICINPRRDQHTICVVEDLKDVMAIENTGQFNGLYHILGGVINPIEGIGPESLTIDKLLQRIPLESIREIILGLSATMEGDTTAFYLTRQLRGIPLKISSISRGIAVGGELEYADEVTLGRAIINRIPYLLD